MEKNLKTYQAGANEYELFKSEADCIIEEPEGI